MNIIFKSESHKYTGFAVARYIHTAVNNLVNKVYACLNKQMHRLASNKGEMSTELLSLMK